MNSGLPVVVVPEEATKRGHILKGSLSSSDIKISGILAQFSNISPHDKRATIYLYPTLEQARMLFPARPPFAFDGYSSSHDGFTKHYRSTEIWLRGSSKITNREMRCLTNCSGRLANLHVTISSDTTPDNGSARSAWFITNGCFLLQMLATGERDEIRRAKELNIERQINTFTLSDGAVAEIKRIIADHRHKHDKEIKKIGYAIQVDNVSNFETTRRDVDRLLILASLASRERSQFWYWSTQEGSHTGSKHWRFGIDGWPKRADGEEPLIPRERSHCKDFILAASKKYLDSSNGELLDSAVYALLSHDLTLEVRIARLFSGIQSALLFAIPQKVKRTPIKELYKEFEKLYLIDLSDVWPLFDKGAGISLYDIRNAAVHGEVFTDKDFTALSFASENLQWILERILLTILGWDVKLSSVAQGCLVNYCAYNWKQQRQSLKL